MFLDISHEILVSLSVLIEQQEALKFEAKKDKNC